MMRCNEMSAFRAQADCAPRLHAVTNDSKPTSTYLRRVHYTLAAKLLAEGVRNRLIREAPATKVLTGSLSSPAETGTDITQATKRHHLAVHANVQAVLRQHNLDDVWKFALGREYLTFANSCQCFIGSDHFSRSFGHRLTPMKMVIIRKRRAPRSVRNATGRRRRCACSLSSYDHRPAVLVCLVKERLGESADPVILLPGIGTKLLGRGPMAIGNTRNGPCCWLCHRLD